MTPNQFRKMALSLPEAVESQHMGHPDFRVGGKIFATLGYPDQKWGMVKLPPEQQARLYEASPEVFIPVPGVWGRRGATRVQLKAVKAVALRKALDAAWQHVAPKTLRKPVPED